MKRGLADETKYLFKVLNRDMTNKIADKKIKYKLNKWYTEEKTKICERGLHLTTDPERWRNSDSDLVCIAEAKEIMDWQEDKCVCKQIKLLAVVSPKLWAEYVKSNQQAWAEYEKVRDQAWAEYEKINQQAWAEYEKVRDQAWSEYEKARQTALAEYKKVNQQALATMWKETRRLSKK